jgi:hypothetical protein
MFGDNLDFGKIFDVTKNLSERFNPNAINEAEGKRLVWANPEQVTLWNAEMAGQVSDGNWENARPQNHYMDITDADASYDSDPNKQGTFGFRPKRTYNFADSTLLSIVGERALFAVKTKKAFPDLNYENHWDWEELLDPKSKERILDPEKERDEYWKTKFARIQKEFGITDEASYNAVIEKINSVPYTMQDMKKDLKQMSNIIKVSRAIGARYESKVNEDMNTENSDISVEDAKNIVTDFLDRTEAGMSVEEVLTDLANELDMDESDLDNLIFVRGGVNREDFNEEDEYNEEEDMERYER